MQQVRLLRLVLVVLCTNLFVLQVNGQLVDSEDDQFVLLFEKAITETYYQAGLINGLTIQYPLKVILEPVVKQYSQVGAKGWVAYLEKMALQPKRSLYNKSVAIAILGGLSKDNPEAADAIDRLARGKCQATWVALDHMSIEVQRDLLEAWSADWSDFRIRSGRLGLKLFINRLAWVGDKGSLVALAKLRDELHETEWAVAEIDIAMSTIRGRTLDMPKDAENYFWSSILLTEAGSDLVGHKLEGRGVWRTASLVSSSRHLSISERTLKKFLNDPEPHYSEAQIRGAILITALQGRQSLAPSIERYREHPRLSSYAKRALEMLERVQKPSPDPYDTEVLPLGPD